MSSSEDPLQQLIEIYFRLRRYQIFSLCVEIFARHNTKGEISQSVRFFWFEISSQEMEMKIVRRKTTNK